MIPKRPLKRSGKLRPRSKKRTKLDAQVAPVRRAFVESGNCVIWKAFGRGSPVATEAHEWKGGCQKHKTIAMPAFWLRVNRFNHDEAQYMPKTRQVALKVLFEPETFDVGSLSAFSPFVDPLEVLREIAELRRTAQ